jgi:hypothetical protein
MMKAIFTRTALALVAVVTLIGQRAGREPAHHSHRRAGSKRRQQTVY